METSVHHFILGSSEWFSACLHRNKVPLKKERSLLSLFHLCQQFPGSTAKRSFAVVSPCCFEKRLTAQTLRATAIRAPCKRIRCTWICIQSRQKGSHSQPVCMELQPEKGGHPVTENGIVANSQSFVAQSRTLAAKGRCHGHCFGLRKLSAKGCDQGWGAGPSTFRALL